VHDIIKRYFQIKRLILYLFHLQNSGTTGLGGVNGQLKLDLGGVVLGAIIGFGAIFILPKILHVFSAGHDTDFGGGIGGYGYRSK
jgi:hypothetical protein